MIGRWRASSVKMPKRSATIWRTAQGVIRSRYLNVVRAVVNHAIREYDLAGVANPFMNLEAARKTRQNPTGTSAAHSRLTS